MDFFAGWSSFLSILEQSNYQLLVKVLEMPYNNDISDVYQSNVNRTRLDEDATFSEMSACPFTEVLTHLYNKSFTMWPCPSQSQVSYIFYHKFIFLLILYYLYLEKEKYLKLN